MRQSQLRIAVGVLAATASCAATPAADARARGAVQRDVEGYAIASCLVAQDQSYLKDQGDGWASTIVQRGKGSLDALRGVALTVKAELAKSNMAVIRSENERNDKPLSVMYCGEIIDAPSVHAAINKAVRKLTPFYTRQRTTAGDGT
jgi:hypothetical protein